MIFWVPLTTIPPPQPPASSYVFCEFELQIFPRATVWLKCPRVGKTTKSSQGINPSFFCKSNFSCGPQEEGLGVRKVEEYSRGKIDLPVNYACLDVIWGQGTLAWWAVPCAPLWPCMHNVILVLPLFLSLKPLRRSCFSSFCQLFSERLLF